MQAEHDENEIRKSFTVTERLAIAQRIAERLQGRQLANLVQNRSGNISLSGDVGQTRDLAAAKAGLGSGKTLEAAQKVVAHGAPELVAIFTGLAGADSTSEGEMRSGLSVSTVAGLPATEGLFRQLLRLSPP